MDDNVCPGDVIEGEGGATFAIFVSPFLPERPEGNRGRLGGDMEGRLGGPGKIVMAVFARVPSTTCFLGRGRDYPRQELFVKVLAGLKDGVPWGWIPLDHIRSLGLQKCVI